MASEYNVSRLPLSVLQRVTLSPMTGRPQLPPDQVRQVVTVRLTPAALARLEEKAAAMSLSRSQAIRMALKAWTTPTATQKLRSVDLRPSELAAEVWEETP